MCSPQVMAKVAEEINRRSFLKTAGAASAIAGVAAVSGFGHSARAQDATPVGVATPVSGPAAISFGPFTQVVDLTHVWGPTFPVFAGATQAVFTNLAMVDSNGWYANQLDFEEHTGTHMDAPAHFDADGLTAELLSPSQLFAPLVIVDISGKAETDPDAQGTPDDLTAWESANGPIPAGAFVALYSGWEARLVDPATFVNLDDAGVQHYPGWHPEAAAWLVTERDIVGVGVDTLSLDYGASADFGTHLTVLPAGKFGIENVANLALLPPTGASIIVGGPKHERASGGPTRAFAVM